MSAEVQKRPEAVKASAKIDNKPEIFSFFAERLDFISWVCYE